MTHEVRRGSVFRGTPERRDRGRARSPAVRGLALIAAGLLLSSCGTLRAPPRESGSAAPPTNTAPPADTAAPGIPTATDTPASPPRTVAELQAAGPTYVEYDEGPVLDGSDRLTRLLEAHLMPVVEVRDLPLGTYTLFWVLVTADGEVADVRLHWSSSVEAFDRGAREVAWRLEYEPAARDGRPVPVWILTRVHLRMP